MALNLQMRGWLPVIREVEIEWDLQSTPLEIKTNSVLGSGDKVVVDFYSAGGAYAGRVGLWFTSTPGYLINWCGMSYTNLPVNLPSPTDKVWRITLTRTAGVRVVIHCNEVEVLNILLSQATCSNSDWSTIWIWDVAKIMFHPADTASDYYATQPEPCGEGTYRNDAMTSCETCDAGLTPNSDKTACEPCPAGSYKNIDMNTCKECSDNTISSEGAALCTACELGQEQNLGRTKCEPCGEGTYRNDAMTSCETCDAGLTPNSDKTACEPCPAGSYKNIDMNTCKECPDNTISSEGAALCTACELGQERNSGRTKCANSVFTAKQSMKRKASDTDLPTKHLIAEAVGPLSFEAMSKLNCQQESLAKMARTARTKAMRHPIAPRSLADLVLTPDYIRTNSGETFLLWDSTYSAERRRSFLFGTVENMDRLAEAPHLVIDGTFSTSPNLFTQLVTLNLS
ncbi:uncharacterized protein LOC134825463 [Bolinopsis microptera]|uniref:uncharacterized protein LOC134825463 n=1 Tax=Bolinopsis microptera TaxID=2820187 RepID=UPI003078AC80